jgi:hypothetical protein
MQRAIPLALLISLAACSRTGGKAASQKPETAMSKGRMETAADLVVGMFPSVKRSPFVCEAPLQSKPVPAMSCHVASGTGAHLLDLRIAYGSSGPYVASLSGDLVHTREHVALTNASGLRYGPEAKSEVLKHIAAMQPLIESFIGRPLDRPAELEMHRVPLVIGGKETSAIVWTVYYRGKVAGSLDIEPIDGSVIRIEF